MTEPTPKPYIDRPAAAAELTEDDLRELRARERYAHDDAIVTLYARQLRALLAAYDDLQRRKSERDPLGEALNSGDGSYRP